MPEQIVVGTDGSDTAKQAVAEATRLAKALGAELQVVSSYKPLRGAKIVGAPEGAVKVWGPMMDVEVDAILNQAAAAAKAQGVEVAIHAVEGDPADALLKVADKVGASTIVVGNQGMHGAKRFVLGAVPNEISHKARCNVLIVSTDR